MIQASARTVVGLLFAVPRRARASASSPENRAMVAPPAAGPGGPSGDSFCVGPWRCTSHSTARILTARAAGSPRSSCAPPWTLGRTRLALGGPGESGQPRLGVGHSQDHLFQLLEVAGVVEQSAQLGEER